jgi:hypothetical protein
LSVVPIDNIRLARQLLEDSIEDIPDPVRISIALAKQKSFDTWNISKVLIAFFYPFGLNCEKKEKNSFLILQDREP